MTIDALTERVARVIARYTDVCEDYFIDNIDAAEAAIAAMRAEVEAEVRAKALEEAAELRRLLRRAEWALQPFSDCVFNDNGDCTVTDTHRLSADRFTDAHFVYRAIRALAGEG